MKLTKEQQELFNTLVRLGDSKELALSTVLSTKTDKNTDIYQTAYYS